MHQTYLDIRTPDELLVTFLGMTADRKTPGRFTCHFRRQDGRFEHVPSTAIPAYRTEHRELLDREQGHPWRQARLTPQQRQLTAREAFAFTLAQRELSRAWRESPNGRPLLSRTLHGLLDRLTGCSTLNRSEPA